MLKKITEPQALYQKDGTATTQQPGMPTMPSAGSAQPPLHKVPPKNKAISMKVIGGIVAFAVILVVGVAGILIAQRQQQVEGPVAPTAPSSEPSAQTTQSVAPAQCNLSFTIQAEPAGAAQCESKSATNAAGVKLSNNSAVRRGDTITFSLTISAEEQTSGAVTVTDVLPAGMTFVTGSASTTPQPTYNANTRTLTFNLGDMDNTESRTISYRATISETAAISNLTNTATVTTANAPTNTTDTCALTLAVTPEGTAACVAKVALTSLTNGSPIESGDTVDPGDTIAYRITVEADEVTAGNVVVTDVLPEQLENVVTRTEGLTYNQNNRTLSIDLGTMATSSAQTRLIEYTATVRETANSGSIVNRARVVTGTAEPVNCPTSTVAIGSYSCNSTCTTNAQCESVNENYTCAQTSTGRRCRLDSNVASTSCEAPDATPTPTPTPTPAASPTPTPSPVIGCNQLCTTNADCVNPSHICYQTADGSKRCRLDENVASESCRLPSTATPTPQQPTMPEELPQSGPEDWLNWLKAGLITLGVGAVLLLLL